MFSLAHSVYITTDTLSSLQIVQSELHPNGLNLGASQSAHTAKESLSVYGLFHHLACTPQGRSSLRRLFLQPTLDVDVINERHQFISLLRRPENSEVLKQASLILRKIGNVRRVMALLRKGAESPSRGQSDHTGAWATLRRFAANFLRLRELIITISGWDEVKILGMVRHEVEPCDHKLRDLSRDCLL
jgi:DNA mismatch repair protein MSH5